MSERLKVIKTDEEFKIFADPYRMRIMDAYSESTEPLTVKMVASIMDEVPAKIHYHIKKLISIDLLELDHTESINGITAKYYKPKYEGYSIELEHKQSAELAKIQVDKVTQLLIDKIDGFKESVIKRSQFTKEHFEELNSNKEEEGFLTAFDINLTDEQVTEYREFVSDLAKKAKKNKEGKRYAFIASAIRKVDKTK